jgi:hypothetical protein
MVRAQLLAAALQGGLGQGAGRPCLTYRDAGEGKVGRQPQSAGVVRAEHPAAAPQRVLTQRAGRLGPAQLDQHNDEGVRPLGGGVVWAEHPAGALQGVLA